MNSEQKKDVSNRMNKCLNQLVKLDDRIAAKQKQIDNLTTVLFDLKSQVKRLAEIRKTASADYKFYSQLQCTFEKEQ